MEFLKRHYEKLILLALSVISVVAVLHMSQVMEKTREVKPSDLEIRIPPADQVSLEKRSSNLRETEKKLDAVKRDLAKATAAAKKSKEESAQEEVRKLEEEKGQLEEAIAKIKEDAELVDYLKTKKFDAATLVASSQLKWQRADHENRREAHFDLVDVSKMAKCPHCNYGVPYSCFTVTHRCMICGKGLNTPPKRIKSLRMPTPNDSDGDGISNDDEDAHKLDKEYPSDATLDADGDGFSNRYEINVSKTDPRNPADCPPLWRRLRFKRMDKIELPITISGIDVGNNPDPKTWEVSIKLEVRDRNGRLRRRDQDCKIGNVIDFDGRKYQVVSIDRKAEKDDRGIERRKDSVILRSVAGKNERIPVHELKLVYGEPVYSPDLRVVLEDIGVPEDLSIPDEPGVPAEKQDKRFYTVRGGKKKAIYALRVGEIFEIGGVSNRNVPTAVYKLDSFDEKARRAQLSRVVNRRNAADAGEDLTRDDKGVQMVVTRFSFIEDEDDWVTQAGDRPAGEAPRGGRPSRRNE